jgi:hypothetical protein
MIHTHTLEKLKGHEFIRRIKAMFQNRKDFKSFSNESKLPCKFI